MCLSGDYPDATPVNPPDAAPVHITRFASVSEVCLLLGLPRWQVISHTLGFYYRRGRFGRLFRHNCIRWLTTKQSGSSVRIAIGADEYPVEMR